MWVIFVDEVVRVLACITCFRIPQRGHAIICNVYRVLLNESQLITRSLVCRDGNVHSSAQGLLKRSEVVG